jgi:hypothetical protein
MASTSGTRLVCATIATASVSFSWYSISRSRYEGFIGLAIAPTRAIA